jgi:four helix bundle suffix protein
MTQGARSGKQNIAEGASMGSTESYIKLLGVAKGSFKELGEDYGDFLRQRKLEVWDKNDERVRIFRNFSAVWTDLNQTTPNTPNIPNDPKEFANMLLTFCQMETYLLKCQIKALEEKFIKDGGFRENLFKKRMDYKNKNPRY